MTNQDREKKIAEIREALEKATPGRWIYDETVGDVYSEKTDKIICCADVNDAHLIANAPEWLRFLLSELEREREENRKLREERDEWGRTAQEAINTVFVREHQLQSAQQDKEKLIEGLRTILNYASEDGVHWKLDRCYTTARDTLKAVGVEVDS